MALLHRCVYAVVLLHRCAYAVVLLRRCAYAAVPPLCLAAYLDGPGLLVHHVFQQGEPHLRTDVEEGVFHRRVPSAVHPLWLVVPLVYLRPWYMVGVYSIDGAPS